MSVIPNPIRIPSHPAVWQYQKRDDGEDHCNYCGSLSIARATELLKTPGTGYSGADWKYGWPHKFYLEWVDGTGKRNHGKVYNAHLCDPRVPDEAVKAYADLCYSLLGIYWKRDATGVAYGSVHRGYQTWGTVGDSPADGAPVVPPKWLCLLKE